MSSISGVLDPTRGATSTSGFSSMSSEDFTKVILTELTKQDPLQPNDTNALLEQIATLRSIQSDTELSTTLGSLIGQNEFASAATLIGKTVSGLTDDSARVTEVVRAVSRTESGAVLTLESGARMRMNNLDTIVETAEEKDGTSPSAGDPVSTTPTGSGT